MATKLQVEAFGEHGWFIIDKSPSSIMDARTTALNYWESFNRETRVVEVKSKTVFQSKKPVKKDSPDDQTTFKAAS